ncbi:zona pellucida sperm-binding protein 3 [Gadus chalcogrammus]|uniref:zona pellucida sperm-binding protein 3 n=1 Tax=Gadus chalcogrammus TaxID=1042646 RepID=UPI0024C31F00|nr:zona pellucida sperm-binding protein 3 [Gadus chalcogrammus]
MGECTFAMLVRGVLFCSFAPGYTFSSNGSELYGDPELEWKAVSRALVEEMLIKVNPRVRVQPPSPDSRVQPARPDSRGQPPNPNSWVPPPSPGSGEPPPLPDFLRVSAADDFKSLLLPDPGARVVPDEVKRILNPFPSIGVKSVHTAPSDLLLKVVCYINRVYVRVSKSLFTRRRADRGLKLGRCPVNRGDSDFYYFIYPLRTRLCGFTMALLPDFLSVITTLRYNPPGEVLWELPFTVTIQCKFHRFHHVYSSGFVPNLMGGTISKSLTFGTGSQLIVKDSSGQELMGPQTYNLGDTIYFEASLVDGLDPDQRLYVNKCYMTASEDSSSNPQYVVIDKLGCMLAGRITYENRFMTANLKNSVNFAISAMIFKELLGSEIPAGQEFMLYMHCEIARGPTTATTTRKSCNYVDSLPRWRDLYDGTTVCRCCSTSCGPAVRASNTLYTSTALVLDTLALEPTSKL